MIPVFRIHGTAPAGDYKRENVTREVTPPYPLSPRLNSIFLNLHPYYFGWFFMTVEHVNGKNKGSIMLYALSTCGWCAKTKELLRQMGVAFDFVYVDLMEGQDQDDIMQIVEKWNPSGSFPILVINNSKCIIGFREQEIRETLGP